MKKNFPEILFYSVPVILTVVIIFLEIWGVTGIWKLLSVVLVLFFGSFLMCKGKVWGSVFGMFIGIYTTYSGIIAIPSRLNMGNAGPRIEPNFENVQWYIWHTEIIWGIVFALFFAALGIFVYIKNRKNK